MSIMVKESQLVRISSATVALGQKTGYEHLLTIQESLNAVTQQGKPKMEMPFWNRYLL